MIIVKAHIDDMSFVWCRMPSLPAYTRAAGETIKEASNIAQNVLRDSETIEAVTIENEYGLILSRISR